MIGIAGFARTGKDSLASMIKSLLEKDSHKCKISSFAQHLKKDLDSFLQSRLGISAFTEDSKEKEIIRPLLVCWGTEVIRNKINKDHWIEKMHSACVTNNLQGLKTIIPDVRFQNEVEWIYSLGGTVIYLERKGISPANSDEEKYTKKLKNMCKFSFFWDNLKDIEQSGPALVKSFFK